MGSRLTATITLGSLRYPSFPPRVVVAVARLVLDLELIPAMLVPWRSIAAPILPVVLQHLADAWPCRVSRMNQCHQAINGDNVVALCILNLGRAIAETVRGARYTCPVYPPTETAASSNLSGSRSAKAHYCVAHAAPCQADKRLVCISK